MSPEQAGLAALVAGWLPPGVYRSGALDAGAVRDVLEASPWSSVPVDVPVSTRREALVALGTALGCGAGYGANLDALWDCLRDLPCPTVVVWAGWPPLAAADPDGLAAVLGVLRERAAEHGDLAVLLVGPGPQVPGVATLEAPAAD